MVQERSLFSAIGEDGFPGSGGQSSWHRLRGTFPASSAPHSAPVPVNPNQALSQEPPPPIHEVAEHIPASESSAAASEAIAFGAASDET